MRSQGQINQQLKQVIFRHLQKRLRLLFKQRPQTCKFNQIVELDDSSYVGLCGVLNGDGEPRHVPCDSRITGCDEMARTCPLWEPLQTKDELKQEFYDIIRGDRGILASEYPDIAALMWVLDDAKDTFDIAEVEKALSTDEDNSLEPIRATWWPSFFRWKRGGAK